MQHRPCTERARHLFSADRCVDFGTARKLAQYYGGKRVPATVAAISDAVRWAEEIMAEIDRRRPVNVERTGGVAMSAEPLRPGAKIAAVQEAGHAVVAVHLGVPVERVQLSSYWVDPLSVIPESDFSGGGVSYLASETQQLTEHAIISAAARIAVDELVRAGARPRDCVQR
jgi:hypothetical protein